MLHQKIGTPTGAQVEPGADDASAILDSQSRRAVLDVDLGAIVHNLSVLRELCAGSKVLAILKGDGYGVGAEVVAAALQNTGVDAFGVDNVGEGIALRSAGIRGQIVVQDGCLPENAAIALHYGLTPGISNVQVLQAYGDLAAKAGRELPIWLHYNCGFNRAGDRSHEDFRRFVRRVAEFKYLRPKVLYSHLPVGHRDAAATDEQISEYDAALAIARDESGVPLESSLLASHGILSRGGSVRDDWVRPGIALYGSECFEAGAMTDAIADRVSRLRPALTLRARLLHKLTFGSTQRCGLGSKYEVSAGQTLGTVAIGFGNGLPGLAASRAAAYVSGPSRYPLVVVGMDYSQVDLTASPSPEVYDWVTLFGDPGRGDPSIGEFAASLGVSTWVLMRQLRVTRRYSDPRTGYVAMR